MAIPVWVPGQVLTASDINNWMVPNAIVKPTDQTVTSSTTLVNDTALFLPVVASATYTFQAFFLFEGGAAGASDLKFNWAVPAGATLRYAIIGTGSGGGSEIGIGFAPGNQSLATRGAANLASALLVGSFTTSTTAGTLQHTWAQNTSSATGTIMHALSSLSLQRTS